jgi:dCMP deaminase
MTRPTWDETWMSMATAISLRSRCVNRQVGAVIVTKENRPMAVGYNGPPAELNTEPVTETLYSYPNIIQREVVVDDCRNWCPRGGSSDRGTSYSNCVSVHAEANALLFADRRDYEGGTMYVTNPCCWDCAKLVANSGLGRLVVRVSQVDGHYDNDTSLNLIRDCGITVDVL